MYVILIYDINQKRVGKALKICRKYLVHVQKSAFEGEITEAKLMKLKNEIGKLINPKEDSVCIYNVDYINRIKKQQIGITLDNSNII